VSIDDAVYAVRDQLGAKKLTRSTLSRVERDGGELDMLVLAALATAYGREVSDIDPTVEDAYQRARDLLIATPAWVTAGEGQSTFTDALVAA
jgi:transcriptional regulator with XRE-family HTH domain